MNDLPHNDHDLLIVLNERVKSLTDAISIFTSEVTGRFSAMEQRLSELEKKAERQAGFFAGANWLKQLIVAAPAGVIAFLLGKGELPS